MTMMTLTALRDSAPLLIKAAQAQLDEWQQDEDGIDEVLGAGGCCGLIADAMSGELSSLGFDTARMGTDFEGGARVRRRQHHGGVFIVDVPARVYETGAGYVWTKRPGVVLTPDDLVLDRVAGPMTQGEFCRAYLDEGPSIGWD